ncbi:MBL fold metallo-hydrolase [Nafulsella turpanensis]|uniref:MBL fold metallo-hydrolase n=1 Tax=Nafulsella turpanensis TaxID=1265690 RepID=UPI00034A713D|nr:MBL fold metallo-hydrolase [Nafulsella turpanensis]
MKFLKKIMIPLLIATGLIGATTLFVIHQPPFGGKPTKEQLLRYRKSPNYKDGKFHNLVETPVMAPEASYIDLLRQQLAGGESRAPQEAILVVKRNMKETPSSGNPHLTWFGHSSYLLQLSGYNLLVDPVFSERTSPFDFVGTKAFAGTTEIGVEDLPAIDFVLITHDHYDHLDYPTIQKLAHKAKGFYVPLGVGAHLERWGVSSDQIHELDWWEEIPLVADLQLIATPARHFSGRGITDRNKTLWASYVLKSKQHSLYLGGDSGYGPHFKEIGNLFGPFDLTLLECGQYHPYWPNIHMMPEETVQAHLDLKGKVLMPVHWGKFTLSLHAWNEPVERVTAKAKEKGVTVVTPRIGEQVVVDSKLPVKPWW